MTHSNYILLVEDNIIDVMHFKRLLEKQGINCPVTVMKNAEMAADFLFRQGEFKNQEPPAPRPGLIILDLNMPRLNGFEFLAIIRKEDKLKDVPVAILTTSEEEKDKKRVEEYNVVDYFTKPLAVSNLDGLMKILRHQQEEDSPPNQCANG